MSIPLQVLILEDRPEDAELMVYELRQAGFDPTWKRVWTEPDFIDQLKADYEVILADFSLPQFNALRALHLVQEREINVPFIVVTGVLGDERAAEIMKQGATDYLLKDRLDRLGVAVVSALEQRSNRLLEVQQEAAAREADEMFSLKIVMAGVRHDIANHLSSILGPAQLIRTRTSDAATVESLDRIIASSQNIVNLIDRMKDFIPMSERSVSASLPGVSSLPLLGANGVQPSERRGQVLIIEDDPILGAVLLDMLSDQHDVIGCLSREDVIQGKIGPSGYEVVLVDAGIGSMVINKLTSEIEARQEGVVFVVMVEYDLEMAVKQFNADFVIRKPFDLNELLNAVSSGVAVYDSKRPD